MQILQVITKGDFQSERGTTFTGDVTLERMLRVQEEGGVAVSTVTFRDGARTNWHIHPGEQVLIILEGECRAGNETEEFRAGPGDIICAPPGEKQDRKSVV